MLCVRKSNLAYLIVPLLMMYKWFADVIDGPVARTCNKASKLGGTLDASADYLFMAVSYVMFMKLFYPNRNELRVWVEGLFVAAVPWLLIIIVNGPNALHSHADFKNSHNIINLIMLLMTENTFVLILSLSLIYSYFSKQ